MRSPTTSVALFAFATLPAYATPVVYTASFMDMVSIAGSPSIYEDVTFTAVGDTVGIVVTTPMHGVAGYEPLTNLSVQVGTTTATVLGASELGFTGNVGAINFAGGGGILENFGPGGSSLQPLTDIPLTLITDSTETGTAVFGVDPNLGLQNTFNTDLGIVSITRPNPTAPDSSEIFTTTLVTTPEPSSFALLGTGVLGTVTSLRRRRKNP